MPNGPIPTATPDPLSVDAAFVVHLTATEAAPDSACGRVEHITSGQSTRFASGAELLAFMRQIVATVVFLVAFALPVWGDDTCLTGSDPEVDGDAAAITALRGGIDTACPCASFDGTTGRARRDYLRCVKREIAAAIDAGELRVKCQSRIKRAFQQSTCGRKPHLQAVPCIQTTTGAEIRCAVRPAGACQSKPGRYARVACPDYVTCVDAGDGNADYLVDRLDSGACAPTPSPTPTTTWTTTPTMTPTWTATATSTATASDTPTATSIDTATATPIDTPTATPTTTPSFTPTVCTASGPIIPHIGVNLDDDPQSPPLLPDPRANNCPTPSLLGGGCAINALDGTIINYFDASATVDHSRCPGDPAPSFHWELFKPPGLSGAPYSSAGISGYHGPVLTILPNSLPSLLGTDAGVDPLWRVRLTIQSNVFPFQSTESWFRFDYQSSSLTLLMSTNCQLIGHIQGDDCTIEAANGLPSTEVPQREPGWTICASDGSTCSFSGPRTVRYGVPGRYIRLDTDGPMACTNTAFGGDPAPGTVKQCEYYGAPAEIPTPSPTPTATPSFTATACTASGPINARIDVNKVDDPQMVVLPPDPAANQCDPQSLLGGGCEINGLDGTITNSFDASATVDGARCPGDPPPSFRWEIFRPPGLGGTPYSAAGIIGYYGPLLTILPNSFPSLEDSEAAGDPNWRVLLSIQSNVFPFHSTQKWFKFEYTSSSLTLQMSTDCQRIGHIQGEECTIEASNGLPSTEVPQLEPGWTVCASEGGTCSFSGPRIVRYGVYAHYALLNVDGPISCTTAAFGSDPAPNQAKHCEYYGAP